MREAVDAENHKTAVVMVRAGPRMPCGTLAAATTLRSQPPRLSAVEAPLLLAGKRVTEGMALPTPKVDLLQTMISSLFTTLAMACANTTTSKSTKPRSAFSLVGKLKPQNLYQFGSKPSICHCHSRAFPGKCRPHFSH
jgi:hypothetical protein